MKRELIIKISTDKIEDWAIREIQALADDNNSIIPELSVHDKGMSFDGFLWLYKKDASHDKDNFEDRISIQIKGHIDDKQEYINKHYISYPVEVADLRIYSQKEGIVYFQVFMTSSRSEREIFYTTLYSSKIKSYLQHVKDDQKYKSITFTKMEKTGDELYSILKQFSRESKKQGSIQSNTVENMIPLNNLPTLKEIHFEAVAVKNSFDLLRRLAAGDICVYGKTSDLPFNFPIEWDDRNKYYATKRLPISIRVNETEYYKSIEISQTAYQELSLVRFSDNLSFEIATNRFAFKAISSIREILKDAEFLRALIKNKQFQFADLSQDTRNIVLSPELEKSLVFFEDLNQVLTTADIRIDKRLEYFTDEDIKAIAKLVSIKRGECNKSLPEEFTHFDWRFGEKYYPLVVQIMDDESCYLRNAIYNTHNMFYLTDEEEHYYRVVSFGYLKKNVVENLYSYDAGKLKQIVEMADVNDITRDVLNMTVLRMIQAYDSCHNTDILYVAQSLCVRLQNGSSLYKINELQIKIRMERLSKEDIDILDEIINNSESKSIVCAANILKGDIQSAKNLLSELDKAERKSFEEWPIYTLMK